MGKASARKPRRFWRDFRDGLARDVPPWVGPHDRKIHQELRDAAPLSRRAAVWTAAATYLRQYLADLDETDNTDALREIAHCALADLNHLLDATKDQP